MSAKPKFDQDAAFKSILGISDEEPEKTVENETSSNNKLEYEHEYITETESSRRGRPKVKRETKQRVSLALLPSLYDKLKKISYVERRSISEIVAGCITQYVNNNESKLQEYYDLKKEQ